MWKTKKSFLKAPVFDFSTAYQRWKTHLKLLRKSFLGPSGKKISLSLVFNRACGKDIHISSTFFRKLLPRHSKPSQRLKIQQPRGFEGFSTIPTGPNTATAKPYISFISYFRLRVPFGPAWRETDKKKLFFDHAAGQFL